MDMKENKIFIFCFRRDTMGGKVKSALVKVRSQVSFSFTFLLDCCFAYAGLLQRQRRHCMAGLQRH